jgi:integrase/recombinase XerD
MIDKNGVHRGIHAGQQSLTQKELDSLLLIARQEDLRDFCIIDLMFELFLRISEVLELRVGDVLPDQRIVCRRKKGSQDNILPVRNLDVWALIVDECVRKEDRAALLFGNYSRRTLDWRIKRYCAICGVPPEKAHAHAMKHTACQLTMDETDGNIMAVKTLAGHSDIGSTLRYTDLTTEQALEIRAKYETERARAAAMGGKNAR